MCGIVGYVGMRSAQQVLLDGLEKLEYRGYDSAGVALALDGGIRVVKSKGRLAELRKKLELQALITGESLAQGMRQVSETPVTYFQTIDAMVKGLDDILQPGDVLLTLGAGTITRVGPAWLEGGKDA